MKPFTIKQILPEFHGMKNVLKLTFPNGKVCFRTNGWPLTDEAIRIGACKLNVSDNDFGLYLHLFTSNNETVGVYKMSQYLSGFTAVQLVEQIRRLCICKVLNTKIDFWETIVYGNLVKAASYKEGCGLATILKDDKWSVIDRLNNYVVPPGKYDYIDGFDKCGLARVKIDGKNDLINPDKSTHDRWGIIDTKGTEVLPLQYSDIFPFYNKNKRNTTIWKGDFLTDIEDEVPAEYYQERVYKYDFNLKTHKLQITEDWSEGNYNRLDPAYNWDPSNDYTMWDAFEGSEEAAAAADFEW